VLFKFKFTQLHLSITLKRSWIHCRTANITHSASVASVLNSNRWHRSDTCHCKRCKRSPHRRDTRKWSDDYWTRTRIAHHRQ